MEAIIAINRLGYIGLNGGLPWPKCSADLAHFRKITDGKTMVAGSVTFNALNGNIKLGNRDLLKFSHKPQWSVYGKTNAVCVDELLMRQFAKPPIVIGGAQTYKALAEYISAWHVSIIDDLTEGDTEFSLKELITIAKTHNASVNILDFKPDWLSCK